MTRQRFGRVALSDGVQAYVRVQEDRLELLRTAPWFGVHEMGREVAIDQATWLCPAQPTKILCIGRNYRAHAKEMGADVPTAPLLFLKPPSSLLAPQGTVLLPPESAQVEHEAELGVIIGRRARRISVDQALDFVFGYVAVGDITARDLQRADGQWSRAKGFDTFCPVGPEIVTGIDPCALRVIGRVNGVVRQDGYTKDMIFNVAQLVSHLSQAMTLEPGDLVATGTPSGVGPLSDGDRFEVVIENIGTLAVSVRNEKTTAP
ncbi:MAG TPA: fumarylacetoacetate hydrolase family protein [Polyangiaceae bacterium]|nr:MAG: Ureidoglycolate lyase [Deltaproteobacteria bacterium ADurb.Bin207]HNS98419.1 fumarylacetoacetate hydrolase family protein [Polyangiaceae bacterium]HNZ22315.1 fumarylacetoacetate hydrolase family protein [Polyangiaceae bacterium]HOD20849.1 fumarylacetoacetate hydrolase family protein [Polyangiaceae bacterium]HOE49113.1 fumarylacetoacetate hydrolase family protein [Polyangiaceae bacterium]